MAEPRTLRIVSVLYLTGIVLFIVGVTLLLAANAPGLEQLDAPGTVLNAVAWPIALVGAIVDVVVHERRRRTADRAPHSDGPLRS